jgi:3'-phosphoadenosine 5'-phosphosulfate (PAPS) 3'-phosphatase
MNFPVEDQLLLAQKAARHAGNNILDKIGLATFSEKADNNLVTEADYAAQELSFQMVSFIMTYCRL